MTAKTIFLQNFLNDVGNSVHSMNSIAVALSSIDNHTQIPKGLNISWNIGKLQATKEMSRNFAIRSAMVYTIETLYEYLKNISNSPFWTISDKKFTTIHGDSKAVKTYNFLFNIDNIEKEWPILVELLGHWRNKIVHAYTSNAHLSSTKRQNLNKYRKKILSELHNFDVELALENFKHEKYTLKDASTLISISIKCAREVEAYYIKNLPDKTCIQYYLSELKKNTVFNKIFTQQESLKRARQIKRWLNINHQYLTEEIINSILIS